MIKTEIPIYLASKSPRRKKLLKQLNLDFKTIQIDFDENVIDGENPSALVRRLSIEKLKKSLKKIRQGIVITADTVVVLNKKIIGKPSSKSDAKKILKHLSGKTHFVYTGFSVFNSYNKKLITRAVKTSVKFRKLTNREIYDYIETGSPMDKAGAYGIQDDFGAVFIEKINGCYYNVVGLPLSKLYDALTKVL